MSGTGGCCLQSRFFLCPPAPLFYRHPLGLSDRGYADALASSGILLEEFCKVLGCYHRMSFYVEVVK